MTRKHLQILLLTLLLMCSYSCKQDRDKSIIVRNYCTEIGRFDLMFYDDEISGSYALLPKKSLGAIWGKLEGLEMKGRWVDEDGQGDIIISFSEDLSFFTTAYRSDNDPEKWYKDSWHGQLRPGQASKFTIAGKTYQCE